MSAPEPSDRPRARSDKPRADKPAGDAGQRGDRLQKVLAAAGIASRRECEQIVLEGRVDIDGKVVTELGTRVDPTRQTIRVDGTPLPRPRMQYYALNKPQGVVTTARDPWARTRVIDLLPDRVGRVFAVGRLDMSSEGLVLLTNDGELANRLAHPRYGIEKTYLVQVAGDVSQDVIDQLLRGVWIAEGRVRPERVHIDRRYKQSTILHVVLREGKNREIRRILAALGHKVQRLRRIAIGPLTLSDLPLGQYRQLSNEDVRRLKEAAHKEPTAPRPQSPGGATRLPAKRPAGAKFSRPGKPAHGKPTQSKPAPGKPGSKKFAASTMIGGETRSAPRPTDGKARARGRRFGAGKGTAARPGQQVRAGNRRGRPR